jgi:aspartate kinase
VGLKSEELQIWKEVDGIFTVDPHKVSTSRLLPIISPEEAAELSYYGSKVIHLFTMEQITRAEIPVRIKNVMNPSGPGSIIFPEKKKIVTCGMVTQPLEDLTRYEYRMDSSEDRPTAVTVKDEIWVVNVKLNHKNRSHIVLAKLFGILDKYHVPVDLVSTSNVHVSLALSSKVAGKSLRQALTELKDLGMVKKKQIWVVRKQEVFKMLNKLQTVDKCDSRHGDCISYRKTYEEHNRCSKRNVHFSGRIWN